MALTVIDRVVIRKDNPEETDLMLFFKDSSGRMFRFVLLNNGESTNMLEDHYLNRAFEKFDEVKEYFEEICLKPQTAVVKTLPRVVKSVQPFYPPAA